MNDQASSFKTRIGSKKAVYLYLDADGEGGYTCIRPGHHTNQLYADDQISSTDVRHKRTCSP